MLDFITNFEEQGDIALIETPEGGYLDTIDGQEVAFSPRNAFFVSFKHKILGVSFPANRQDLGRWLRSLRGLGQPRVPDYLQLAVNLVQGRNQMVVAMDLADLFTPRMTLDRLCLADRLAGKNLDLALCNVKGQSPPVVPNVPRRSPNQWADCTSLCHNRLFAFLDIVDY